MRAILLICFCFVCLFCNINYSLSDDNPYKQYTNGLSINGTKPIEWNSVEGRVRLTRTKYKKPFLALAHHFSGQEYPSTCGPASARIILSAIYEKIGRPFLKDKQHSFTERKNGANIDVFKITERNVFDFYDKDDINYDIVARLKKRDRNGYNGGISLNQLASVIASHPNVIVDYVYPLRREGNDNKATLFNNFRETVKYICSNDDIYIIILYNLTASYNKQSGHYSPIVAYDEITDSVLIMDVASHLGTWIWVPLEDLFINMNPVISGTDRGYIVVKQTLLSEEEKLKQMEAMRLEAEERIMSSEKEEIDNLKQEERTLSEDNGQKDNVSCENNGNDNNNNNHDEKADKLAKVDKGDKDDKDGNMDGSKKNDNNNKTHQKNLNKDYKKKNNKNSRLNKKTR